MFTKEDIINHNKICLYPEDNIPFYIKESNQFPSIAAYLVEGSEKACVIMPGGGYFTLSEENEGRKIAQEYNKKGVSAFVCFYRVRPHDGRSILLDAQKAMAFVRHNAKEFGIDKDKIFVCGFSAGAHLCMLLCEQDPLYEYDDLYSEDTHPNGCIMCYPVCTFENGVYPLMPKIFLGEKRNDPELLHKYSYSYAIEKMPCTYIMCTVHDVDVPPSKNTVAMAECLDLAGKDFYVQFVNDGRHGIGLGLEYPEFSTWFDKSFEYITKKLG